MIDKPEMQQRLDGVEPTAEFQRTVTYRCVCGCELRLNAQVGGLCERCGKEVSPRQLAHELASTISLPMGNQPLGLLSSMRAVEVAPKEDTGEESGRKLGHFELLHQLGRGGMGQVYRALDTSLQRYVAVKLIRRGAGRSEQDSDGRTLVDKLLHEAVAQARVNHPNVVAIYYVGRDNDEPFLAMELVSGETVEAKIRSGPLPFAEIISTAVQITDALRVAYELDIIHGDIKPSNILVQAGGTAKLSDFGMAQRVSSAEQEVFGGTPNYLAPELLAWERPSLQSDMYALGVTLFEMTFSRLPIEVKGSSIREWAESHTQGSLEFPSPWPEHLPEGWKKVLERLLNKEPAQRYESYEALLGDLYRLTPVKALPARPLPRLFAAMIDYGMVATVFAAVTLLAWFLERWWFSWLEIGGEGFFSRLNLDLPWYLNFAQLTANVMVGLSGFVAIGLYSLSVGFWRQSVGRGMLHVRVYNKYGLPPSARLLVAREALRMAIFWALPLVLFVQVSQWWAMPVTITVLALAGIFWLVDFGWMVFSREGKPLHDRLMETSVVLDTSVL